jgi:SAM-dependent MidA family methyltransferase
MNDRVLAALLEAIAEQGPITFARFMEIALYGPHGYYERPPIGPDGDFVTSPHVHPVFGQLLAEAIRGLWEAFDEGTQPQLLEVGAGDGTLLREVTAALDDTGNHRITAIERSSGAREALASLDEIEVLTGIDRAIEQDVFARGPGVMLVHEVLDNLPFRRVTWSPGDPTEVRIDGIDGRLVEVMAPLDEELRIDLERTIGPNATALSEGGEIVVPTGAMSFMDTVATAISGAGNEPGSSPPWYILAVDYGTERGRAGEVHGYRGQRVVEDLLMNAGASDITAGVAFEVLGWAAERGGMTAFPTVSQREALMSLGFETWLRSALERQADLLNTGRGSHAVRMWSRRTRAMMLIDPAGLGRFRWFVAGTPGLPAPHWLERASARP